MKAGSFDSQSFDAAIFKAMSRNGKQFALPYDFGPLLQYYNKDMFEKEGLPLPKPGWTEDDFNKAAKALTKDGHFGTVVSVPDAFTVFARSKGARYLDDQGQLDLTNDKLKAAFADYVKLVATDPEGDPLTVKWVLTKDPADYDTAGDARPAAHRARDRRPRAE